MKWKGPAANRYARRAVFWMVAIYQIRRTRECIAADMLNLKRDSSFRGRRDVSCYKSIGGLPGFGC
jgi:hypothetical protein